MFCLFSEIGQIQTRQHKIKVTTENKISVLVTIKYMPGGQCLVAQRSGGSLMFRRNYELLNFQSST